MTSDENQTAPFSTELLEVGAEGATQAATRAGAHAADLVEAWVRGKNAAAVAALASDDKAPAVARKAARRGLAVLKARGVPIPDRARVARIGGDEVEDVEAWFVAPDAAATSAILLTRRWKSGRHEVLRVPFRDGVGLLQIQSSQASGTQLRALLAELGQTFGFEPVPVPVDWARWRLAAARAAHVRSGAIVPLGLDTHADLLGPVPAEPPPHPVDAAKLEVPDASTAAARSAELHMEPEFAGWMPSGPAVQELLVDVGRRASAVPADNPDRFDVALRDALDGATDRFFTPEAREQVATLLKDAAISVLARRGRDAAGMVVAVAAAVRAAGLITDPPHELPFLRAFFQKALGFIASKNNGQLPIPMMAPPEGPASEAIPAEVEASSPIISPAEAAQEKAKPGEKVSPGGIILP
jgi:hypothetical protein